MATKILKKSSRRCSNSAKSPILLKLSYYFRDHPDQISDWLECQQCNLRLPDNFSLKNHLYHSHPTKKRGKKRSKRVDVSVLCQFCAFVLPNQEVIYLYSCIHSFIISLSLSPSLLPLSHPSLSLSLKNHLYYSHPTKKRSKRVDISVLCQFCAFVLPNQEVSYQHSFIHSFCFYLSLSFSLSLLPYI
jgi:hypothetical protein